MLPRRKVIAIGGGRYRVITTIVEEVDEEQLAALGLEPPPLDLPWAEEKPRRVTPEETAAAMAHWVALLGEPDQRLKDRLPIFIRDNGGLDVVRQAIDQVAATNPKGDSGVKYAQVVRVLREIRSRNAGPGP